MQEIERKRPFFSRDSEGAFGSESATGRGSFWTRIRWGKAVAARSGPELDAGKAVAATSGVRGQGFREQRLASESAIRRGSSFD